MPEQGPRGGIVHQDVAVRVDHPDTVAEAVHDRAEQAGLPAALRLGDPQPGRGDQDLVAGPGPAGGQDVHQPGQHDRQRGAAEQHGQRKAAARARQVRRVGAGDQRPLPVRDLEDGLPAHVAGASGGVGRDLDPPAVEVRGEQFAVQLALAGGAQDAAQEVLAAYAEHQPADEPRLVARRVDRRHEGERELLPADRQAPVPEQDVGVGGGRAPGAARFAQRRRGLRRRGHVGADDGLLAGRQRAGEDREEVFRRIAARVEHQSGGAEPTPVFLGRRHLAAGCRHDERDRRGAEQLGGLQRPGGGGEIRIGEPVVGARPGRGGLQQGSVAAGLGGHRGAGDGGALVHHQVRVLPLDRTQPGDREQGDGDADDQDAGGEQRSREAAAAAARRGG